MTAEENALLERLKQYEKRFDDSMDDDLNTADAIGAIFECVRDINSSLNASSSLKAIDAALESFLGMTDVLGLVQRKPEQDAVPEEVIKMAEERAAARKNKDWKRSDELRDAIKAAGYIVEDTPQGPKLRKL